MNETTKHTPGPWYIVRTHYEGALADIAADAPNAACTPIPIAEGVRTANARLIAAAPEMLAALYAASSVMTDLARTGIDCAVLAKVNQIIAKASGECETF